MSVARQYTTARSGDTAAVPRETATAGRGPAASPRLVPAQGVIATRPAVPLSVVLLGICALLVAAWGAAAPFAGPDFGFVADRATAWQWSVTSACLGLGPGALAFLASLIVVGAATRTSYARRLDLWLLGFVVVLCGAWFVVGQYVWPVVYGMHYIAPSAQYHFMWKELAFAIGPGVILVFCGAMFMGWASRRQLAVVATRVQRSGIPPSGTVGPAMPGGVTTRPRAMSAVGNTGTMAPPASGEDPVVGTPAGDGTVAARTSAAGTTASGTTAGRTTAGRTAAGGTTAAGAASAHPVGERPLVERVEPPVGTSEVTPAATASRTTAAATTATKPTSPSAP
jgi:hypothetical protein